MKIQSELLQKLEMTYDDMCAYLKQKYGPAIVDYCYDTEKRTKNRKVTRTNEGLLCHHIGEIESYKLCDNTVARFMPFEYQKAENLVYCDYLEHLILHLKIGNIEMMNKRGHSYVYSFSINAGYEIIISIINELYASGGGSKQWEINCFSQIKERKQEYFSLLKGELYFLRKVCNYTSENMLMATKRYLKYASSLEHGGVWEEIYDYLKKPFDENDIQIAEAIERGTKADLEIWPNRKCIVSEEKRDERASSAAFYKEHSTIVTDDKKEEKSIDYIGEDTESMSRCEDIDEIDDDKLDEMRQRTIWISVVIIVILIMLVVYYAV